MSLVYKIDPGMDNPEVKSGILHFMKKRQKQDFYKLLEPIQRRYRLFINRG
jgi:hypothetical protein